MNFGGGGEGVLEQRSGRNGAGSDEEICNSSLVHQKFSENC